MEKEIKRNLPRDLFLHLLTIVTLYWSATSFVTLLWQYINKFFPNVLEYRSYDYFTGPMRFAIASLIIVFPIFILVSWVLNKIYLKEYAVRESKIRKWLIYLTLFIASLIIIGDLVSVLNALLNGDLTTRFILKALSILLVSVLVFWYYLDDVRRETPTNLAKPFAILTSILVLTGVVGAFFIVGSPIAARLIQFDQQKIYDLQGIQSQIINYWQRKETLPNSLLDLNDPVSNFKIPVDPQTGQSYEYKIIYSTDSSVLKFELCAKFNKEGINQYDSMSIPVKGFTADNWNHPAGYYCFQRTIDKELYPPFNKVK